MTGVMNSNGDVKSQRGDGKRLSEAEWAKIRLLWTSDPTATFSGLARQFGITKQAIRKRANKPQDPWIRSATPAELRELALAEVDRRMLTNRMRVVPSRVELVVPGDKATASEIAARVAAAPEQEDGPQEITVEPDAALLSRIEAERRKIRGDEPEQPVEQDPVIDPRRLPGRKPGRLIDWTHEQTQVEGALLNQVEIRAQVIEKHRREWVAARQLSYEAIKGRDFERAKLAKITAETIAIIQKSERVAYGLDIPDDAGARAGAQTTVVIEREALPPPSADSESDE